MGHVPDPANEICENLTSVSEFQVKFNWMLYAPTLSSSLSALSDSGVSDSGGILVKLVAIITRISSQFD